MFHYPGNVLLTYYFMVFWALWSSLHCLSPFSADFFKHIPDQPPPFVYTLARPQFCCTHNNNVKPLGSVAWQYHFNWLGRPGLQGSGQIAADMPKSANRHQRRPCVETAVLQKIWSYSGGSNMYASITRVFVCVQSND